MNVWLLRIGLLLRRLEKDRSMPAIL